MEVEDERPSLLVLGSVEVMADGVAVPIGGSRVRDLLAVLAAQPGRSHTATALADVLDPDGEWDGSGAALRMYLSRLRSRLASPAAPSPCLRRTSAAIASRCGLPIT